MGIHLMHELALPRNGSDHGQMLPLEGHLQHRCRATLGVGVEQRGQEIEVTLVYEDEGTPCLSGFFEGWLSR